MNSHGDVSFSQRYRDFLIEACGIHGRRYEMKVKREQYLCSSPTNLKRGDI